MHLLLKFIILFTVWTCLGQAAEQTGQATKSDVETSQGSSTPYTVHSSVHTNAYNHPQHQATTDENSSSVTPNDTGTTMSDALNGTAVNEATTTHTSSSTGSGDTAMTRTTASEDAYFLYNSEQIFQHSTNATVQATGQHISSAPLNSPSPPADPSTSTFSGLTLSTPSTNVTNGTPKYAGFEDSIRLTTKHVSACFQKEETLYFNASSANVGFYQANFNKTVTETCRIYFTVPTGMVLRMQTNVNNKTCMGYDLYLQHFEPHLFERYVKCTSKRLNATSTTNHILFTLRRFKAEASLELVFSFTAVLPPPKLELVFITPTTGYVQTEDWNGSIKYNNDLDLWARLDVPTDLKAMVSFWAMDINDNEEDDGQCDHDILTVYVGEKKKKARGFEILTFCNGRKVIEPTVFHTHVLRFHFISDDDYKALGFKIHFSFLRQSEIPEQLDDGKWNCSVPFWPTFQHHFNCNMVEECSDGEDERHCGPTANQCARGYFPIGPGCYMLLTAKHNLTWNEAANDCVRRGAHLVSFETHGEWREVIDILRMFMRHDVYVGLQITGPSLPELYVELEERRAWIT